MSKPFASEETIQLPVPPELADELAGEIYRHPTERKLRTLLMGTVVIGTFRLSSLSTELTAAGTHRLVAVYQRVYP